jgi:CBS-domain-containing membrane protein
MRLVDLPLLDVSVPEHATFRDASETLADAGIAALAVVREDRTVAGLFTDDDFLRGVFPAYVEELHHTAFVRAQDEELWPRLEKAAGRPVTQFARKPLTVELESGALHVAQRFLHCPWGAVAVVERGRYVGMLRQVDFVQGLLRIVWP